MMKPNRTVAVIQSNYIPWKGYFDIINSVDEFIIYDEAQYTRSDWRNRNQIKTRQGLQWLSIPVCIKGKLGQSVLEAMIANPSWAGKHWESIRHAYKLTPYFDSYSKYFEPLFVGNQSKYLSEVNHAFIVAICSVLGIQTKITWSHSYKYGGETASEKLLNVCLAAGATHYISGPRGKSYLDQPLFEHAELPVTFFDYSNYPTYHQSFSPFVHTVSILDLIFNEGPNASQFMKSFGVTNNNYKAAG